MFSKEELNKELERIRDIEIKEQNKTIHIVPDKEYLNDIYKIQLEQKE